MTVDFDKLVSGGPGPIGDYCRRLKADGSASTPLTNAQLKESGAGFWADMVRQGGTVIGGGGGGLLGGLSWTAGISTTLSTAGGFARATAVNGVDNPRIIKGPFALTAGTHTFSGQIYERTAVTNLFFRVSLSATIATNDFYEASVGSTGGIVNLTGTTFNVASPQAAVYCGIIPVITGAGQYGEIDDLFNIT